MTVRKYQFIALAFLGFCLPPLLSCAPSGSGLQSYAPVAAPAPGTARVWFLRTKDPQEQFGDPIIFANGNQIGRSVPGIAFSRDVPPGTYAFAVQSYGLTAGQPIQKDTVQPRRARRPTSRSYGAAAGWKELQEARRFMCERCRRSWTRPISVC